MIKRLKKKNIIDIFESITRIKDRYRELYITQNKNRIFLNNMKLIEKLMKRQEFYGVFNKQLEGLFLIYHEKGYRTYLKFLCSNIKYSKDLLKYIKWNFAAQELFIKFKKNNPLARLFQDNGFRFRGDRGEEILLMKPKYENKNRR